LLRTFIIENNHSWSYWAQYDWNYDTRFGGYAFPFPMDQYVALGVIGIAIVSISTTAP
jgi:flavin-dependent dehydrogenase